MRPDNEWYHFDYHGVTIRGRRAAVDFGLSKFDQSLLKKWPHYKQQIRAWLEGPTPDFNKFINTALGPVRRVEIK